MSFGEVFKRFFDVVFLSNQLLRLCCLYVKPEVHLHLRLYICRNPLSVGPYPALKAPRPYPIGPVLSGVSPLGVNEGDVHPSLAEILRYLPGVTGDEGVGRREQATHSAVGVVAQVDGDDGGGGWHGNGVGVPPVGSVRHLTDHVASVDEEFYDFVVSCDDQSCNKTTIQ